ncbi:MAG: hypothetical protein DWQ36_12840 [Acidobacteria bacterium]|nr:MAG: hypothetical protein DWQ30_04850 [Acidobacteriota bacterium]REK07087.1 MAG: hypothetical protein DWQ36_12840 [Acidobacteriota bacterium]
MQAIVKWLAVLAILAAAYVYGRPWFEDLGARIGLGTQGGGSLGEQCVAFAEGTVAEFVEKAEKWGDPPIQLERWSGSYRLLRGRLQDAYSHCGCELESCREGDRALDRLAALMESTNDSFRDGRPVDLDVPLDRLRAQLDQAARLAADGY